MAQNIQTLRNLGLGQRRNRNIDAALQGIVTGSAVPQGLLPPQAAPRAAVPRAPDEAVDIDAMNELTRQKKASQAMQRSLRSLAPQRRRTQFGVSGGVPAVSDDALNTLF